VVQQRLFASVDAQYQLGPNLAGNTISGFSVSFHLAGHTLGKHLDLSASVYNVFNKTYFNPGSPRTQKIPFNRTEELSGSNSQAGFEAQHAILGQRRIEPSQPRLRATLRIGSPFWRSNLWRFSFRPWGSNRMRRKTRSKRHTSSISQSWRSGRARSC